MADIVYIMFQKPRLNAHRKKQFRSLVAEMAVAVDDSTGSPSSVDDVLSHKLTDDNNTGLSCTARDINSNVDTC